MRDLAPHWNASPFVRTAGIPSQTHFRVKKNVSLFSELSKVRGLGLLIWKTYNFIEKSSGRGYGGRLLRHPDIRPQFVFEAANCRWKWQNYFGNLEWQFVSKVDVQETPYKCKPKFAPRLIIQICARSALSLITWLLYFFWRGKGKAKLMEDGAQEKLYEYKFKFASKPYHANLRTKQIVIDILDIIDIMKLFENWGSNFFGRCYPSPFWHTAYGLSNIPPTTFRAYASKKHLW